MLCSYHAPWDKVVLSVTYQDPIPLGVSCSWLVGTQLGRSQHEDQSNNLTASSNNWLWMSLGRGVAMLAKGLRVPQKIYDESNHVIIMILDL